MERNAHEPLKVFIGCPGDMAPERAALLSCREHIESVVCPVQLVTWKSSTPGVGDPQKVIFDNDPIESFDIVIIILWKRLGVPSGYQDRLTGKEMTGTEAEFIHAYDAHQASDKQRPQILLYRCERRVEFDVNAADVEEQTAQLKNVQRFFRERETGQARPHLPQNFKTPEELCRFVVRDIKKAAERLHAAGSGLAPEELRSPVYWVPKELLRQRVAWAAENLNSHLRRLNEQLDWSEGRFVELEAELEENSDTGSRRRVSRLVDALRRTGRREIILVLGEPGTGKSVALRRLTAVLLAKAKKTGILPLYLNLREWPCPPEWTSDHLPEPDAVTEALWQWVRAQMHVRIGGTNPSFVADYAEELRLSGRLFFLLDSFDETRALLDLPKESALVERIAEGARRLLCGDADARGVIASRYDRNPARWLNADRWYELRPLENRRIEQLVRQHFAGDSSVWHWLKQRPELATLPRNPFELFLIAEHLEREPRDADNHPVFPKKRAEAYASCLRRRLARVHEHLTRHSAASSPSIPSLESLEERLRGLAEALYRGPRGLEIAIRDLGPLAQHFPEPVVHAFVEARLLRAGEGEDRTLSFVHSRFGEALAAHALMAHPDWIEFEDIPTVGRWRDVLIVYFEIADLTDVKPLALRCFKEIRALGQQDTPPSDPRWVRAIRCLRFLDEACRYRREATEEFAAELSSQLRAAIRLKIDPLTSKLLIEGLSLAAPDEISALLALALDHPHPVVRETAVWAVRYLTKAESSFFIRFRKLLISTAPLELLSPRWNIMSHVRNNPALRPLAWTYFSLIADAALWGIIPALLMTIPKSRNIGFTVVMFWIDDSTHAIRRCFSERVQVKFQKVILAGRSLLAALFFLIAGLEARDSDWRAASLGALQGLLLLPFARWVLDREKGVTNSRPFELRTFSRQLVALVCNMIPPIAIGLILAVPFYLFRLRAVEWAYGLFFAVVLAGELVSVVAFLLTMRSSDFVADSYFRATSMESLYKVAASCFRAIRIFYRCIRHWFDDARTFRNTMWPSNASATRTWIERTWNQLITHYWRARFVDRLQAVRDVTGAWTGQPPYMGTDRASRRLMKLDERWLGLER